jgi:4-amino-4-deoxy-L-arabinose transferase-like glycosyltransferase
MVPSVALFGLNEFGVRFPMALVGTITPFVVFLLIKKLSNNLLLSFLTAFSLAISPWHIHYSRASFEAVVALFFLLLGTLFFLEGKEGRKGLFLLSIIFLVLSMYAYHAEKIFTPIFFLMLVFLYRKEVFSLGKNLILLLGVGFLFFLPLLLMMLDPRGQTRAKMTFISQDIEISRELHLPEEKLSLTQKILDNNLLILGNFWIKRYLNYWDPRFIFLRE